MMTSALSLGMVLMLAADAPAAPAEEGALKEGDAAPVFTGKVLNADVAGVRSLALDQLVAGKKAVILSFFATYCEPCKKELPFLQALHTAYKDQGLGVAVVSIDQKPEDITKAQELAQQVGATYPVLSDRFNIVAKRYSVKRLPCLYILDGTGKVSLVSTGYSEEFSAQLLAGIQARLEVPADPKAVALPEGAQAASAALAVDDKPAAAEPAPGKKKKGKRKK